MKTVFAIFVVLFCSIQSYATHIMGGDLTYRYITDDSFEFTLAFYVDCVNGNPGAIASDKFAILGFFNAKTKKYIDKVEVERNDPVRVSKLNYACVTPPSNACVDRYEYVFSKKVDVGKDGIIVSFQRCCRNHTITNLVNPGGTGMTLLATIPPKTLVSVNSNPVFKDSPPNFLCNDAPLVFDHSATDLDGDSLVYDLYLPFEGADPNAPRPSQPSNPDYDEVTYTTAYNLSNLMGGTERLKINQSTGQLTVIPDKVGQYVVGIRVSEFRDGVKIGETLRDYQFNVLDCDIKISANFDLPEIKCYDSVVYLKNTSKYGMTYDWKISKSSAVVHETHDVNPSVTLNQKGQYSIKLVAKNDKCADSIEKDIEIGEIKIIKAEFDLDLEDTCTGGLVRIRNNSDKTPDWYWDLGLGAGEQHNITVNQLQLTEPGEYTIKLRISDTANCALDDTYELKFNIHGKDTFFSSFDYSFPNACDPGELVLVKTDDLESSFHWEIKGQKDKFENSPEVTLQDLDAGRLNVVLKHNKSSNPCHVYVPEVEEIQVDSLEMNETVTLYNVFTPGTDGSNDCFKLDMQNSDSYEVEMYIYSRWGELVYQTENALEDCWDGIRGNHEIYPGGTYFGVVKIKHNEMDKSENISITITLIH